MTFVRGAAPGAHYYSDPMRGFAFISPKLSEFEYAEQFRKSGFELAEEDRYSPFEFDSSLRDSQHEALVANGFRRSAMGEFVGWGSEVPF